MQLSSCGAGWLVVLTVVLALCVQRAQGQPTSRPAASGVERPASAPTQPQRPPVTIVPATGPAWKADLAPQHKTVDLAVGEEQAVLLEGPDGKPQKVNVKLVKIEVEKDDLRAAVRKALVTIQVNGQEAVLTSAYYNLPQTVGGVQVDCPAVKALLENSRGNPWRLEKDARVRVWPAGAAWIDADTFGYPLRQRWFAGPTQMANEPTYVDGVESPTAVRNIYYHSGLDFGGAEALVDILSTTDGLVVVAGNSRLAGYDDAPIQTRYDTVYVVDRRGWFHRYSHLLNIDPDVKVGRTVKMGQRLGALGKEGDSGGWSHLHYHISARQPSGKWGIEEAYAFVWEAYRREQKPKIVAVARPHHLASAGSTIELDGRKSWSAAGKIDRYEWSFTDGSTAAGPTVKKRYDRSGQYCEILKVTDANGNVDCDFAIVQIIGKGHPKDLPPGIHLAYFPTTGLKPGAEVTFKVRSFGTTAGQEQVDFGDGTAPATVKSDGNVDALAKDGYAALTHAFAKAGRYIVTARRSNERGQEGVARVLVVVE